MGRMTASWLADLLRCPQTRQPLQRGPHGWQRCGDGCDYPDRAGFTSLVWPPELAGSDARMNRRYEWLAPVYDLSERLLGRVLTGLDMARVWRALVDLVPLQPGVRLLEVSPGPGIFQPLLRAKVGADAQMAAVDLSLNMLRQCQQHHAAQRVELVHANAQHLPFADGAFDALFHFGGVNLFNDPAQALREFVRVTRVGGLIVWGDERMSAGFKHPLGRRILPRLNPGFRTTPPPPPAGMSVAARHVVYNGLGYLVVGFKT
jgi:ubiquinone/menaquinone biosynthesis C-methylase UbiE